MNKNNAKLEISINLIKTDFAQASKQIGLTDSQADSLWQVLQEKKKGKSRFNFSTIKSPMKKR